MNKTKNEKWNKLKQHQHFDSLLFVACQFCCAIIRHFFFCCCLSCFFFFLFIRSVVGFWLRYHHFDISTFLLTHKTHTHILISRHWCMYLWHFTEIEWIRWLSNRPHVDEMALMVKKQRNTSKKQMHKPISTVSNRFKLVIFHWNSNSLNKCSGRILNIELFVQMKFEFNTRLTFNNCMH